VGVVNLAVLACVLRRTTEKGRQLFWGKKCNPRKIIPATPMHRLNFVSASNLLYQLCIHFHFSVFVRVFEQMYKQMTDGNGLSSALEWWLFYRDRTHIMDSPALTQTLAGTCCPMFAGQRGTPGATSSALGISPRNCQVTSLIFRIIVSN